jgi:hypothetical protein
MAGVRVMLLFWLLAAHALCDYALQGDFMAKAKNRANPIPGVPWYQAMGSHALIHGAAVTLITGSLVLGIAEVIAHFLIDDAKCVGRINYNADQAMHALCKVVWAALAGVI